MSTTTDAIATTTSTAVPSSGSLDELDIGIALYNPIGAPAIIACLLFLAVAISLWTFYFKESKPRPHYMRILLLATTAMSLGFLLRFSRRNAINAWSYLFETIFILLAPCGFLALNYMILPRLSTYLKADDCLYFPKAWLVKTFVIADILTFLAQLAGTALTATYGHLVKIGTMVVAIALGVQALFFAVFLSVYIVFGMRLHSRLDHSYKWYTPNTPQRQQWKTLYYTVGASSICLTVRSIYRLVEYASGSKSYIATSEPLFYCFDTLPLLVSCSLFVLVWPPRVFESSYGGEDVHLEEGKSRYSTQK